VSPSAAQTHRLPNQSMQFIEDKMQSVFFAKKSKNTKRRLTCPMFERTSINMRLKTYFEEQVFKLFYKRLKMKGFSASEGVLK
jgi:hypothetical protein